VPPQAIPGTLLSVPLAIVSRGSAEAVVVPMDLDELVDHWTLLKDERELVAGKRGPTRLGFALLLKFCARTGRFPRGRAELDDNAIALDELCPMRRLISSIAMPLSDSRETNVYRSSRGVHSLPMPAFMQIVRSDRRTLAASSCVPSAMVKTSPLSSHRTPARRRAAACRSRCSRSTSTAILGIPRERRDFFVLVSPWARTERHTSTWGGTGGSALEVALQVDMIPPQCTCLFGPDAYQETQHNEPIPSWL